MRTTPKPWEVARRAELAGLRNRGTQTEPKIDDLMRTGLPDAPCFLCGARGWCEHRRPS